MKKGIDELSRNGSNDLIGDVIWGNKPQGGSWEG